ncbi:MAG: PaaI family thioesterase [Pseudomonadota bacterium]
MTQALTPGDMGIPNYKGTFLDFLDFRIIEARPGFVRMRMPIARTHTNTLDMAHGGIIMSMLDIAGAFASHGGERGDEVSVTMTQSTQFMRAVLGDTLYAEGQLTRRAGRTAFTHSTVFDPSHGDDPESQICATAQCTFLMRPRDRSRPANGESNE